MKPVFLVGFMGSGKSTLGYAVSRKLNMSYIDLDIFIENRFRASIKELYNTRGEKQFRILEQNMLHEVGEFEDVIVSCGGGTPLYGDNMEYMKSRGTTVWLNASIEVLTARLCIPSAKAKRPLLANLTLPEVENYISKTLTERNKIYSQADIEFNADRLDDHSQIACATESLADIITHNTTFD